MVGTLDITIMEFGKGVFEVKSTSVSTHISLSYLAAAGGGPRHLELGL